MALKLHCDVCDKSCDTKIVDDKPSLPDGWTRVVITHEFSAAISWGYTTSISEHTLCSDCSSIVLGTDHTIEVTWTSGVTHDE